MSKVCMQELCTGCTACVTACPKGCIAMVADENGFLCPVIDEDRCVSCGLCKRTCPIVTPLNMAGNEPKAYAAYSVDKAVRLQSSSGGVFTEIANAVLAEGGTVFGAAYNEQFEVMHICVDSKEGLAKLRGAKYAQSDLCGIFTDVKAILDVGQKVLFCGTPCQVGGLKAFLRKDYQNLLTIDFVCHSVPSPMAWKKYVEYRSVEDNNGKLPKSVNLRIKTTGWSRYQYSNLFQYSDGISHSVRSSESLYMKLFTGGYISRESCENCQFKGYIRVSDLTLGDFWGIWDIAPEMDDNKGTSVVLVQSPHGAEYFNKISKRLIFKAVTLEEASSQNQAIFKTSTLNTRRQEALSLIKKGKIENCKGWFATKKTSHFDCIKNRVKTILRKIVMYG